MDSKTQNSPLFFIMNIAVTIAYVILINWTVDGAPDYVETILPFIIIGTCAPAILSGLMMLPVLLSKNAEFRGSMMRVAYNTKQTWMAFSPTQMTLNIARSGLVIIALSHVGWIYTGMAVVAAFVFGLLYEGIIRAYLKELH